MSLSNGNGNGTTTLNQTGNITINGGTLNTGALVNNGGTLSFTSGTLRIEQQRFDDRFRRPTGKQFRTRHWPNA